MSKSSTRLVLPLILLVIGAALLGSTLWITMLQGDRTPAASAIGGPFALIDQDGRQVTDADFKGSPTLMFFGYTHCPDVCPTTLFDISQLFAKFGPDKAVKALFVTVDPERDTPSVMKDYVSNFDKRIVGLTGDRPAIDAALKAYRVYSKKVPGTDGDYSMDHSAIVYLMDENMRFVNALNLQQPDQAAREIGRYF
jgi:protein SCO1/2